MLRVLGYTDFKFEGVAVKASEIELFSPYERQ
jgi:hypothetical protein